MTDYKSLLDQVQPGPWIWRGHITDVKLCTKHGGQVYLMGARRKGLQGAQFTFQNFTDPTKPRNVILNGADHFYQARAPHDPKTIFYINHPLADLIRQIPEMVSEIYILRATVAALKDDYQRFYGGGQ